MSMHQNLQKPRKAGFTFHSNKLLHSQNTLHIQISYIFSIFLDELAAGFYLVAHQIVITLKSAPTIQHTFPC